MYRRVLLTSTPNYQLWTFSKHPDGTTVVLSRNNSKLVPGSGSLFCFRHGHSLPHCGVADSSSDRGMCHFFARPSSQDSVDQLREKMAKENVASVSSLSLTQMKRATLNLYWNLSQLQPHLLLWIIRERH